MYSVINLVLYWFYSAILYLLAARESPLLRIIHPWSHWVDGGWYALLISLSSGTNSVFFFGFYFSIMVASFRWGFRSGMRMTIVAAALYAIVGYATTSPHQGLELNRFLLRPTFLLVFGYMLAYRGGFEIAPKRRLALLKDVTALSNPRFGVNRTIGSIMQRLRAFYDADACILIVADPAVPGHFLRRADRSNPEAGNRAEALPKEFALQLLAPLGDCAAVYSRGPRSWWRFTGSYHAYDPRDGKPRMDLRQACEELAARLDTESYVTVPFRYHNETIGRSYLTARRRRVFHPSDVEFLIQVIEQVTPVIDTIRLVDRLASNAAEEERRRITRDIHDSVIQPYIGLQFGLSALRQRLSGNKGDVAGDVDRLIEITNAGIAELRGQVQKLREKSGHDGSLVPGIQRFAATFADVTGINVQVVAAADLRVNDRLAAELFQLVAEGLSNVRRHTRAARVTVGLEQHQNHLVLRIENDGEDEQTRPLFRPLSIVGRAEALGGHVQIKPGKGGSTVIHVEIPL